MTFNRTSMESKLPLQSQRRDSPDQLLIEPVWNRNLLAVLSLTLMRISLLIEPVWNRNDCNRVIIVRDRHYF